MKYINIAIEPYVFESNMKISNSIFQQNYLNYNKSARIRAKPQMFRLRFKVYTAVFALKKLIRFFKKKIIENRPQAI